MLEKERYCGAINRIKKVNFSIYEVIPIREKQALFSPIEIGCGKEQSCRSFDLVKLHYKTEKIVTCACVRALALVRQN